MEKRLNMFDRLMAAVTFAEAGEQKTSMEFLNQKEDKRNRKQAEVRKQNDNRPVLRA